jgi:hypothetical protein
LKSGFFSDSHKGVVNLNRRIIMTSFVVTATDDILAAAKAALSSIEGAIITDVAPDLEQGLLSLLQSGYNDVVTAVGNLFTKLVTALTGIQAATTASPDTTATS